MSMSSLTFAMTSGFISYLAFRCASPPNEPRDVHKRTFKDLIGTRQALYILPVIRLGATIVYVWHSIAALCGNTVGTDACLLHPRPSVTMNQTLFTWNIWSISVFSLAIFSAVLRLRSFGELGADFTFELQKPKHLITSGVYEYVQHPSYSGVIAFTLLTIPWFFRYDGILATLLPIFALQILSTYGQYLTAALCVAMSLMIFLRVKDEEAVLREHFGKEWEEWHDRTARFFPFIF